MFVINLLIKCVSGRDKRFGQSPSSTDLNLVSLFGHLQMQIESLYSQNSFSVVGVEPALAKALEGAFINFIEEFKIIGWQLDIEIGPRDGWTASIIAPVGVKTEERLPQALDLPSRLKLWLDEQYRKWVERHTKPG
jgi:hypothetical protein